MNPQHDFYYFVLFPGHGKLPTVEIYPRGGYPPWKGNLRLSYVRLPPQGGIPLRGNFPREVIFLDPLYNSHIVCIKDIYMQIKKKIVRQEDRLNYSLLSL